MIMEDIVHKLKARYSHFTFEPGEMARWSPGSKSIVYSSEDTPEALWGLLHEVGHALLDHTAYTSDAELLQKEAAAWYKALEVSKEYGTTISAEHIEQCLDTYRDWLYKRSLCPVCHQHGLQASSSIYKCPNCSGSWRVTQHRFCRTYRLSI